MSEATSTLTITTNATEIVEAPAAQIREIKTAKGNVIGTEYLFELGDTKALKSAIKSRHPDWGNKRISAEVAVMRRDKVAASRLQADAFVGMQFAKGNIALFGKDKNSGKSTLHFEKIGDTSASDEKALISKLASKLAEQMGWTMEQAMEVLSK